MKETVDNRTPLPEGSRLHGGSRSYVIEKRISAGSNSIVYQASYEDTLMPEHVHTVLIKELYPLDFRDLIKRKENMELSVPEEAKDLFVYHKESYLLGNQAHLTLSSAGSGHIAENLDSFEANGTLYTVLTSRKGQVLSKMQEEGLSFPNVTAVIQCLKNLLNALASFHSHRLLHLDISPDNIFLLIPREATEFPTDVLLLDFNSVYSIDADVENECQYYLGKKDYMAPEVILHQKEELGPWTDLYSVSAVFYQLLTGELISTDRELCSMQEPVSPYSALLLHEKEQTAHKVNEILKKGLALVPAVRYQTVEEMQKDLQELLDILNGAIRIPMVRRDELQDKEPSRKGPFASLKVRAAVSAAVLSLVAGGFYMAGLSRGKQPTENTELDLSRYPLETDGSVVLTQRNARSPLPDNILTMQVNAKTYVEINLKDYEHPRNGEDVFASYALFSFYNGEGDKRGWQNGGLTYDFFHTEDNSLQMVLPLQDTSEFNLEYMGVVFQNYNYDDTAVLLDITRCTLTDGKGNDHEMTELVGSHVLFFDEENWQMNLMTTQNQEFVTGFDEIYGGQLTVDAAVCRLDPVLELSFKSEDPKIASVDGRGAITGNSQGTTTLTVTATDKATGEEWQTQMLVHVTSALE